MTKEQLAAAMAAFEQKGGKVEEVPIGVSGNHNPVFHGTVKHCGCGCNNDWTEHTMRLGERGILK